MAIKKLDVTDIGKLQTLVIDNIQGLEPDLTVLDSRLLLGHATIDLVAMDANTTLVLVALGFSADEEMLLKAVEAYSWCLEYPEAIHRLYPAAQVSESRPPRMIFVVGRIPDAFHRKVKQLGFPEVDCVEFRHLEVDGAPVLYFETLLRLRRAVAGLVDLQAASPERRIQAPANGYAGAPVARPSPAVASEQPASAAQAPRAALATAPASAASVVEADATAAHVDAPSAEAAAASVVPSSMEPLAALLEQMTRIKPSSPMTEPLPAEAEPSATMPTLEVPGHAQEPQATDALPTPEPAPLPSPEPSREVPGAKSIAEAARAAFAAVTPSFTERPATPAQPATPAPAAPDTPAVEKPKAEAEATKPAAPLPQEFAGLNFPNDGVLTRQWMEFLSRMANSK